MSRAQRARSVPSWQLCLLLLLCTGSTLARAVHWLAVPHRLCRVHGTLEHGSDALESDAPLVASDPELPAYRAEGRAHDECPLGPQARIESTPLPDAPRVLGLPGALPLATLVESARATSIPLLFLAPKHSPPA